MSSVVSNVTKAIGSFLVVQRMSFAVPRELQAAVQERDRFEELSSRYKADPNSLSVDELEELLKLKNGYDYLNDALSSEKPFSDY